MVLWFPVDFPYIFPIFLWIFPVDFMGKPIDSWIQNPIPRHLQFFPNGFPPGDPNGSAIGPIARWRCARHAAVPW